MKRLGYTIFGACVGLFFGVMMAASAYGWSAGLEALLGYASVFAMLAAMFGFIVDACRWPWEEYKPLYEKAKEENPNLRVNHFTPPSRQQGRASVQLRPSYPPAPKTSTSVAPVDDACETGNLLHREWHGETRHMVINYVQERIEECAACDNKAMKAYWEKELRQLKGDKTP